MNNLLKDLGHIEWVAKTIEKGVSFIYRHTFLLAEFWKRSHRDLRKYSDTRFGYNFLMMESIKKSSSALKQFMVSDEFEKHHLAGTKVGKDCKKNIGDSEFWEQCSKIVDLHAISSSQACLDECGSHSSVLYIIIHLLRMTDSLQPCIGRIYEGMDKMIEKLAQIETDQALYEEMKEICTDRWSIIHRYMQQPLWSTRISNQGSNMQTKRCQLGGTKLVLDPTLQRTIRNQLAEYRALEKKFGKANALLDRMTTDPCVWWEDYGADAPELHNLAIKILSQAVSSSCLETMELIQPCCFKEA